MGISTHVLDTAAGRPAVGVPVTLELRSGGADAGGGWLEVALGVTDDDGRVSALVPDEALQAGRYRIGFDTGAYFAASGVVSFFPSVHITFDVADAGDHYHLPLLLSPYGYTTYRGS